MGKRLVGIPLAAPFGVDRRPLEPVNPAVVVRLCIVAGNVVGDCQLTGIVSSDDRSQAASSVDRRSRLDPVGPVGLRDPNVGKGDKGNLEHRPVVVPLAHIVIVQVVMPYGSDRTTPTG